MSASPTPMPRPGRMPFWDNARFAVIVLVVAGHAMQRLTYDSDAALGLYLLVYAFHMPALAIVSGYFSKSGPPGKRQMGRVLTDILLPYVIFETLWTFTKWIVEGGVNPNPTQPSWTLWFLLSLGTFRLVLPYLALLRWPLSVTAVISVGVGYLPNVDTTLSLSRTLGLLVFFTLGWWLRDRQVVERHGLLDRRPWWAVTGAVAALAAAGAAAWLFVDRWREMDLRTWLFSVDSYAAMGDAEWWAGGVRVVLILVALLLSAAFLVLVPRRQTWWTHFGQYTMYVYLLHSFVLYPFRESGVLRGLEPVWLWLPLIWVASALIAMGLSTRPVRAVFRPLVQPRWPWLFADPALAHRRGHGQTPPSATPSHTPPPG